MKENHKIFNNVIMGKDSRIDEYAIIGYPPKGQKDGSLRTTIGSKAVIRSHTVVYSGNVIGDSFQSGHNVMIRENNKIGNEVSVGTMSVIEHDTVVGNRVRIHSQAFIPEFTVLEDECWIGPGVVITNAKYPKSPNVKKDLKGVHVKKNAIIGANSTLLPGVCIGESAIGGSGSVVTKDVPDGSVVAGNPAKVINNIENLPYKGARGL